MADLRSQSSRCPIFGSLSLPTAKRRFARLKASNLRIDPGEIIGLVGESGAGKTTLARTAMGLIPPPGFVERGQVLFDGRDLSSA